jgi:hypothetical protein
MPGSRLLIRRGPRTNWFIPELSRSSGKKGAANGGSAQASCIVKKITRNRIM